MKTLEYLKGKLLEKLQTLSKDEYNAFYAFKDGSVTDGQCSIRLSHCLDVQAMIWEVEGLIEDSKVLSSQIEEKKESAKVLSEFDVFKSLIEGRRLKEINGKHSFKYIFLRDSVLFGLNLNNVEVKADLNILQNGQWCIYYRQRLVTDIFLDECIDKSFVYNEFIISDFLNLVFGE